MQRKINVWFILEILITEKTGILNFNSEGLGSSPTLVTAINAGKSILQTRNLRLRFLVCKMWIITLITLGDGCGDKIKQYDVET